MKPPIVFLFDPFVFGERIIGDKSIAAVTENPAGWIDFPFGERFGKKPLICSKRVPFGILYNAINASFC